jgi:hypothetical protein
MKLQVGERLPGSGPPTQPGGYVVTEVISETPWSGLYGGKRVFYNFDFTDKRPRETDEKEWLDVLLRTVNYPRVDSADYVAGRHELARAECRTVLGNRSSNLWPEPLDVLEVANTRDPFTFARPADGADPLAREPVVVFARPHGDPLVRWRQGGPPASALLALIAELLEFLRATHDDGLLLNGLGPAALLIDRAGRMHYLGTELVMPLAGAAAARRFFPPERYPRGYSAPECFDPARPLDPRTDLYAWAALTYFLLTADRPPQLAFEQGQPWAHFQQPQLARLGQALRAIPPEQARDWAGQLAVDADALGRAWPQNLVDVLRRCLDPEPGERPPSVADLRAWLTEPPPPPPPAAVGLRVPQGESVRLFVSMPEGEAPLEMVVRRGHAFQPLTAQQGEAVAEGPARLWAEDTLRGLTPQLRQEVRYSVFTRKRHAGGAVCSVATPVRLIEPLPSSIRQLAEDGKQPGAPDMPEPPAVQLLFKALDAAATARALLGSPLPQVRGWAIRRLAAIRKRPDAPPAVEELLWRAVEDPVQALRLDAVRGLAGGPAPENVLRRLFAWLAVVRPADCIPAARVLMRGGVSEETLRPILAAVSQQIPTTCPVCGASLPDRDTAGHLVSVHGYLEEAGTLLPRDEVLGRLWDRVFDSGDAEAHERLCGLLGAEALDASTMQMMHSPHAAASPYVAALESEILRRAGALFAAREEAVPRLVKCLRQSRTARALGPYLLRSAEAQVRELARELLLPELGDRLAGEALTAAELRRHLNLLCPGKLIEEKILLCERLPLLGVDAAAVEGCLRQLQAERPVVCSECGKPVAQAGYEAHLRQAHQLYEFGGVRRALQDTLGLLLEAMCSASPAYEAWAALEAIMRDVYHEQADLYVTSWLAHKLQAVGEGPRVQYAGAMAEAITAAQSGGRLVPVLAGPVLAGPERPSAALLALQLVGRLTPPVEPAVTEAVKPLLADRSLPRLAREAAVATLLRTTGKGGPAAVEVLRAFVAGRGKAKAIQRLRELEQRAGQMEAIDAVCAELEDQLRMSCPRCQVELRRLEMITHLWDEHRLILEGRRAREPWRVIEDWIEDYRLERDPEVLGRCRSLAERLEGEPGWWRVQQLVLQHEVDAPDLRRELLERAARAGASLCPHCFAQVPVAQERAPLPVRFRRDGWSADGYRVEVSEGGLVPRVEIATPRAVVLRGREPGRRLTRKGGLVLLAGPLWLAAAALAGLHLARAVPLTLPAAGIAGGLALLVTVLILLRWPAPEDPRERAVDHGWARLVPRLKRDGFPGDDLALVAGLALVSPGRGSAGRRARVVAEVRNHLERALRTDARLAPYAGAVWRLAVEDRGQDGEDPVNALAAQAEKVFEGKMPLGFAGGLLGEWEMPWWTRGNRNRLRVLLCAAAFEAGLDLSDLAELGRLCPPLAEAMQLGDGEGLARLRRLWVMGKNRPWEHVGQATTVFEVAADAAGDPRRLERRPDLLLVARGAPVILLCDGGVWFQDVCLTDLPRRVAVEARRGAGEGGFDLVLGEQRFWFSEDPAQAAARLERWLGYYFRELPSQMAEAAPPQSREALDKVLARSGAACPECRRPLLPRAGEIATALGGEATSGRGVGT